LTPSSSSARSPPAVFGPARSGHKQFKKKERSTPFRPATPKSGWNLGLATKPSFALIGNDNTNFTSFGYSANYSSFSFWCLLHLHSYIIRGVHDRRLLGIWYV
jgi:hypothetical protein